VPSSVMRLGCSNGRGGGSWPARFYPRLSRSERKSGAGEATGTSAAAGNRPSTAVPDDSRPKRDALSRARLSSGAFPRVRGNRHAVPCSPPAPSVPHSPRAAVVAAAAAAATVPATVPANADIGLERRDAPPLLSAHR
jgi:hypothetical protein